MTMDRSFIQLNRASGSRIRTLVSQLNDQQLLKPIDQNWTVAITLAHLAFWDGRVLNVLNVTEENGHIIAEAGYPGSWDNPFDSAGNFLYCLDNHAVMQILQPREEIYGRWHCKRGENHNQQFHHNRWYN